ncbi:hypothetical protein D9758_013113 [Tetrapyrgos nigripes]|uniref:F-box domain-containing protein n=1 Tax=Tetrapyrgos nigripes TaxID=182062 RepID=A0A8H5FIK6_9AGAR|nr:hypothetical protein D9758_013113 [Tetrapyrgos nigripes]
MELADGYNHTTTFLCSKCNATLVIPERFHSPLLYEQLRAVHQPSETEVVQIKFIVSDIDRNLASCDAELMSLNKTLAELDALRRRLQRLRDSHVALLAPVRKLPVELLLHIFSLLCIDNPGLSITTDPRTAKFNTTMPTINIARTCSQWRKIALSNPHFWSNIVVDLGSRPWNVKGLADLYLRRSEPALLTIRVEANRPDGNFEPAAYDEERSLKSLTKDSWSLFQSLLDEQPRWSRASFYLSVEIFDCIGFKEFWLEGDPNNLEHLEVNWTGDVEMLEDAMGTFFARFEVAPALKTLQIKCFESFPLPFNQLVRVQLLSTNPYELKKLASLCPHLKELEIHEICKAYFSEGDPDITSQSLEALSLTFRRFQALDPFLSFLHLPNLTALSLHMKESDNGSDTKPKHKKEFVNGLKTVLQRSPGLHRLSAEGDLFSDSTLLEILLLISPLQSLTLLPHTGYDTLYTKALFDALHFPSAQSASTTPSLVPQLTHLKLEFAEADTVISQGKPTLRDRMVDPAEIVSMLESRHNTLRHFEFHAATATFYEELEDFQPGGAYWERLCVLKAGADSLSVTTVFTKIPLGSCVDLDEEDEGAE